MCSLRLVEILPIVTFWFWCFIVSKRVCEKGCLVWHLSSNLTQYSEVLILSCFVFSVIFRANMVTKQRRKRLKRRCHGEWRREGRFKQTMGWGKRSYFFAFLLLTWLKRFRSCDAANEIRPQAFIYGIPRVVQCHNIMRFLTHSWQPRGSKLA